MFILLFISNRIIAQSTKAGIVVPSFKNNLYGFCDTLGVVKAIPTYDNISDMEYYFDTTTIQFTTALFSVYKNEKCLVINHAGKIIILNSTVFDSAYLIHYFPEIIQLKKDNKIAYFIKTK